MNKTTESTTENNRSNWMHSSGGCLSNARWTATGSTGWVRKADGMRLHRGSEEANRWTLKLSDRNWREFSIDSDPQFPGEFAGRDPRDVADEIIASQPGAQ